MTSPKDDEFPRIFERLAAAVRPVELSATQRSALRERVLERARRTAPEGTITRRATDGDWIALADKVEMKVLHRDAATRVQTILMRVAGGGMIPGHRHSQDEEFIVLEGECHIGAHRLVEGDVHIAAAGSWHDDITTQSGVMVLVRGEYQPDAHA